MTNPRQRFSIAVTALVVLGGAFCAWPHTSQAQPGPVMSQKAATSGRLDGA